MRLPPRNNLWVECFALAGGAVHKTRPLAAVGLATLLLYASVQCSVAWAGNSDADIVTTIIKGLEHNESLVPKGRGIYIVTKFVANRFQRPKATVIERSAHGTSTTIRPPRPAVSIWTISWTFDGPRYRSDVQTVLPLPNEGRRWDSTTHAYDGERAFRYVPELHRCVVASSPVPLIADAVWHVAPGNDGLLMPRMLGRKFGTESVTEVMRASNLELRRHDTEHGDRRWVLAGKHKGVRRVFTVGEHQGFRLREVLTWYHEQQTDQSQPDMELLLKDYERVVPEGGWLPTRSVLRMYRPAPDGGKHWLHTYTVQMTSFTAAVPHNARIFTLDSFLPVGTDIFRISPAGFERIVRIGGDALGRANRMADELHGRTDFDVSDE